MDEMVCNTSCSSEWSREEDITFENSLAIYPEDDVNRWEKIAADVPGKTLQEIKYHYQVLVDDVNLIESGFVILPCYKLFPERSKNPAAGKKASKGSKSDQERRKGIPWTEEEHKLFIEGLKKYGQGDWRSISRNYVVTRTPTQVASHAQKYYLRLKSMKQKKERRRSSIHDITHVQNGDISAPQGPTTGQASDSAANQATSTLTAEIYAAPVIRQPIGSDSAANQATSTQTAEIYAAPVIRQPIGSDSAANQATSTQTTEIYAAPVIGQPVGGPLVSAVGTPVNSIVGPPVSAIGTPMNPLEGPPVSAIGTPVNLPAPGYMTYALGPNLPAPGYLTYALGPVLETNLGPMPYPMQHPYTHS